MVVKSYAKINLRLKVTGINEKNYHLLQMINTKINFFDILRFKKTKNKELNIYMKEVKKEDNLIYKVADYMFNKYNLPGGLDISVKKNIMIGAGLAGGSTNAATTIHAIDKMYKLNLTIFEKREIASLFGADITYCLENNPAIVEGIGEQIIPFDYKYEKNILIVNPNIAVSTKEVFSKYDSCHNFSKPLSEKELSNLSLKDLLANDLETVVLEENNQIKDLKECLCQCSPHVLMSGSGSTIYAIDKAKNLKEIAKKINTIYPEYICILTKIR